MRIAIWWMIAVLLLVGCRGLAPVAPTGQPSASGAVDLFQGTLRVSLQRPRSVQTLPTQWDTVTLTATCNRLKVQPATRSYATSASVINPPATDLAFPTGSTVNLTAQLYYQSGLVAQGTASIASMAPGGNPVSITLTLQGPNVTSLAGNGFPIYSGDGGPAPSAQLNADLKAVEDAAGNIYVTDAGNARIRKVAPDGTISTLAGTGYAGFQGDNGPATRAKLSTSLRGLALDSSGNVYVADMGNQRIRMVCQTTGSYFGRAMTAGNIYTVVGGGASTADGVSPLAAQLTQPQDLAVDSSGNLFFSDLYGYRVRMVCAAGGTFFGQVMASNIIYTIAGNGTGGYSGDGIIGTSAQVQPIGVALDSSGNVFFVDSSYYVRMVARNSGTLFGRSTTAGFIYSIAGDGGNTGGTVDGQIASGSYLYQNNGITVDPAGNVLFTDGSTPYVIRTVARTVGTYYGQSMLANFIYRAIGQNSSGFWGGDGGPASASQFTSGLWGVSCNASGDFLVCDSQANRVQFIPAAAGTYYGQSMAARSIHVIAGNGVTTSFSGDGSSALAAQINNPQGVALDSAGNLLFADAGNQRIRKVTPGGVISTFAGTGTGGFADGTALSSQFNTPGDLAIDAAGNLYVADTFNHRIRKISTAGVVSTVAGSASFGTLAGDGGPATAASLYQPTGIALDSAGNVYLADSLNARIRMVCTVTGTYFGVSEAAGNIYSIVGTGGTGSTANGTAANNFQLGGSGLRSLAVDANGNLIVSCQSLNKVFMLCRAPGTYYGVPMTTAGQVYAIAGGGGSSPGDGGPATSASLSGPAGVGVDATGQLYFAENGGHRIRRVSTSGTISTVAGSGSAGWADGIASASIVNSPGGLVVSGGKVYFSDSGGYRVRVLTPQ
jgi:sugar lactone lactonase YvrE